MLKIKDNIDLKELEKRGYTKHNNEKALVDYYIFKDHCVVNVYKDRTIHIAFPISYNEYIKDNDETTEKYIEDIKDLIEKEEKKEEQDYIQEYNDFWKDIVENEDGTLNKDQVMRELSDYSMVMDNCARAYCLMTHSRISKQNTMFFEVENIFYDLFIDKDIVIDDMSEILKINDIDELKKKIRDYFDIGDSNER